jgi:LysR family hydrogen peroxide-inducible transcriptional activator
LTLVQLEYIIALDNYRHFALAAEKCFVTQPTLSMQIQKLEDSLGVLIFDRRKHPIEPTSLGEKILGQARTILAESKKIKEVIDDENHEIKGTVKIGIIPTLAPYLAPLFIDAFVDKYPKINLQINECMTDQLLDKLKKDQIDIGILVTPLEEGGMKEVPLFHEEFYVYASHRHPLFGQKEIDPTDLKHEGLWILDEGHCFRTQMLSICNAKKADRFNNRVLYESGSLEALKKLVDKRGGYTLLPELFTLDMNKDDKSKLRKFSSPPPTREVSLIVKESYAKVKLLEAMHKEILFCLPPIMASRKDENLIKF